MSAPGGGPTWGCFLSYCPSPIHPHTGVMPVPWALGLKELLWSQGPQESILAPETLLAGLATSGGLQKTLWLSLYLVPSSDSYWWKGCFLALGFFWYIPEAKCGTKTILCFCFLCVCLILFKWCICNMEENLAMETSRLQGKVFMRNTHPLLALSLTYAHVFLETPHV